MKKRKRKRTARIERTCEGILPNTKRRSCYHSYCGLCKTGKLGGCTYAISFNGRGGGGGGGDVILAFVQAEFKLTLSPIVLV